MRSKWLCLPILCFIVLIAGCDSERDNPERKTGVALMEELGMYMEYEKEIKVKTGEDIRLNVLVENRSVNDYSYVAVNGCDTGLKYKFSEGLNAIYRVKQKIDNGVETTGAFCTQGLERKVFQPGDVVQLELLLEPIKPIPADLDSTKEDLTIEWDFGGHRTNTKISIVH